jgi:hypothetical protein
MKTVFTLLVFSSFLILTRCAPVAATEEELLMIYPDSAAFGINILDTTNVITKGSDFSFSAIIPEKGSLVVRLTKVSSGNWYVNPATVSYWAVSVYDPASQSQTFTSTTVSKTCDLHLEIQSGKYLLEYYENDDSNPTFTRSVDI